MVAQELDSPVLLDDDVDIVDDLLDLVVGILRREADLQDESI